MVYSHIHILGRNCIFHRRQYAGAVVFLVDMPLHTTMCDWHKVYFRTAHTWQIGVTVYFPHVAEILMEGKGNSWL